MRNLDQAESETVTGGSAGDVIKAVKTVARIVNKIRNALEPKGPTL